MKPGWLVFILSLLMCGLCNAESAWARELYRLDNSIEKEYEKKYCFEVIGTGGGGVEGFSLYSPQFKRYNPATIDEARSLVLEVAEDLLNKINANEKLKNGMISYPFTPNNLGYAIFFAKKDGNSVEKGEVFCTFLNGRLVVFGLETEPGKAAIWIKKPLSEELLKVENSRSKFPYLWECVEKSGAGK